MFRSIINRSFSTIRDGYNRYQVRTVDVKMPYLEYSHILTDNGIFGYSFFKKKVGDFVKKNESICEVDFEKWCISVDSPFDGTIVNIYERNETRYDDIIYTIRLD